jgi:hypothetical protein
MAIEAGARRLVLGDGSLQAKVRRGARLRRLTTLGVPAPVRTGGGDPCRV